MRGLFTKIFLGFWIAQSLTFAISTLLIMQHSFVRPNEIMDVLKTALPSEGAAVVNTYETAGCDGLREYAASRNLAIYLADAPGHLLCDPAGAPAADVLAARRNSLGCIPRRRATNICGVRRYILLADTVTFSFSAGREPETDTGCAILCISHFLSYGLRS